MIFGIIAIFFISFLLVIFPTRIKSINRISSVLLVVILALFAAFRERKLVKDYEMYVQAWNRLDYEVNQIEVSFIFIRNVLRDDFGLAYISIFITYALLGVITKVLAVKKLSDFFYLSILIYISHFYILHELTQIRAGVAAGFILLAIIPLYKRNFKLFLLFITIAILFHYSAIMILPLWFLKSNSKVKFLYFVVPAGFILYFVGFNFMHNIPIAYFQTKMDAYQELSRKRTDGFDTINVFNVFYLIKVAVFYFILINREKISHHNAYFYLLLRIEGLSLLALPALALIPAIAYRVHEFLGVVEIILFPLIVYAFKRRYDGYILVIALALLFLYVNIFYNQLILA